MVAAFTHGISSKWTYLSRTVPGISTLLQPLEDVVREHLLPSLTGRSALSELERELLALPARLGCLGMINAVVEMDEAYKSSVQISAPLCALVACSPRPLEMSTDSSAG